MEEITKEELKEFSTCYLAKPVRISLCPDNKKTENFYLVAQGRVLGRDSIATVALQMDEKELVRIAIEILQSFEPTFEQKILASLERLEKRLEEMDP